MRKQAWLFTSIWDDPHFTALSEPAQRTWFQIISQKRLTIVGVVPYQPRNWARGCPDTDTDRIERCVQELEATNYVIVDHATEELLVRTMMKHDPPKGPRAIAGAWAAFREIDSLELKYRVLDAANDAMMAFLDDESMESTKALVDTLYDRGSRKPILIENENRASSVLLPLSSVRQPPPELKSPVTAGDETKTVETGLHGYPSTMPHEAAAAIELFLAKRVLDGGITSVVRWKAKVRQETINNEGAQMSKQLAENPSVTVNQLCDQHFGMGPVDLFNALEALEAQGVRLPVKVTP